MGDRLPHRETISDDQIGKVSLVGEGMRSNPGIAATMFRVLASEGINIQMIDTSTIRITVVLPHPDGPTRTRNSPSSTSRSNLFNAGLVVPG